MQEATMAKKDTNSSLVESLVLKKLGTPPDLHSVQSTNVFGDYWRVNVRTKLDTGPKVVQTSIISDSFLIKISNNKIVDGDTIPKKYKS
jgi:hypothetical protein